jgi:predicted nucleotidyltransferase
VEPDARPPALRFFDLLRVLADHQVEFVVIGGFALAFHGAERATKDVDIVPAPAEDNLSRLWRALAELEAEPQGLEDSRPEEMPVEWGLEALIQGGGNWILHTSCGRLDLMQWVMPFDSYDELRANAVEAHVDEIGAAILVAGVDDLIAMKEFAGRDQDRIDIAALRMARGLEE